MKTRNEQVKQAVRIWLHTARAYVSTKSEQTAAFIKSQAETARTKVDEFIVEHAVCTARKMNHENIRVAGLIKDKDAIKPDEIIPGENIDMLSWVQSIEQKMKGCCKF